MAEIPRDESFDSTLAFLSEGYTFISSRCRRYGSDLFQTRLMLRPAVCTLGAEAAEMFYQPDRFTRRQAIPSTALMLLQDRGSVQTLSGEEHLHRKQMFLSLMTPQALERLNELLAEAWRSALPRWEASEWVVLHDEVQKLLCRAICFWAGVPLNESAVERRTDEFAAMIDGAGAVGPRNWRGMALRARNERWVRGLLDAVRSGRLSVPEESAAHVVARHRKLDGTLLETKIAAVELINILRPTVAVARFITFAALALHAYPECRQRLLADGDTYLEWFVHEVRRFYPFFPAIAGFAREAFEWRGHPFQPGDWVFLDLYGTNHDPRSWDEPELFQPERFRTWDGSAYNFIPQGGGDYPRGHRCPGEWITTELMKTAVRLLTGAMRYDWPEQDTHIDLSRMPALPTSGVVFQNVRRSERSQADERTLRWPEPLPSQQSGRG